MQPFPFAHAEGADWRVIADDCLDRLGPIPTGANLGFLYVTDSLADELGDFLRFGGALGGLATAIHPAAEEPHVGQVNPAEGVERGPDDQTQQVAADEADPKREEAQRRVLRAFQKFTAVVWG